MLNKWFQNINRVIPIKYHILFWVAYFVFNIVRWGSYFNDYWYSLKSNLVEFPLHIIVVYIHIYYLIPKFILKKKYKRYVFLLITLLGIHYLIRTGLNYLLVTENIWPEAEGTQEAFTFNHIVAVVLGEIYVVALASAIKLTVDWVYERSRVEKLRAMQIKTELSFLKSQIQPHFFFNTLNNLYALTLEKSDVAPNVVLKLSDIMQYVLYEVKEPKISLFTEINYIQNYLDLERLRFGDHIQSETNIVGDIENVMVPPLLFLPFIENCFKHGTKDGTKMKVLISFERVKNKWIIFTVENSFNSFKLSEQTNDKHGIGIKNVKRRLELLYKNEFELKNIVKDNKYRIELQIPVL